MSDPIKLLDQEKLWLDYKQNDGKRQTKLLDFDFKCEYHKETNCDFCKRFT